MRSERYRTLAGAGEATYREKASRFMAYAFPIADEEAFQSEAARLARRHHDARHHCYAWVLGVDGARKRANDAGEPQGTAGRPILRRIEAAELTYTAVVVVRYFGGTLLGKGGLVRAYGEAAQLALQAAPGMERAVRAPLTITCDHALAGPLRAAVLDGCAGRRCGRPWRGWRAGASTAGLAGEQAVAEQAEEGGHAADVLDVVVGVGEQDVADDLGVGAGDVGGAGDLEAEGRAALSATSPPSRPRARRS